MLAELRSQLAASSRSFGEVFKNPNLRRIELAFAGSLAGEWASLVALSVFAYESGGAPAVGLVGLIRMLPAAVAAPFLAALGDRYRRERVMVWSDLTRAAAMAAAAVTVFVDGPPAIVYSLAGVVAVISTAFRPAQAALLPALTKTPHELTAANVVSSTMESLAFTVGPAFGGLLLAVTSTGVVLAVQAGTFVYSAIFVARIDVPAGAAGPAKRSARRGIAGEVLAGLRTIALDGRLRVLMGLVSAQSFVAGARNVLIVVSALQLFHLGQSGVGFLTSAVGVGGLLGVVGTFLLVGRSRLAAAFGSGIALWGVAIALIGVLPNPTVALVLLGAVGIGNTLIDVSGTTLLQRTVPDDVLARVFGALETVIRAPIALGAIVAPLAITLLGVRGAWIAVGALLPVLAAASWRRLRDLDVEPAVPYRQLELLRGVPFIAVLSPDKLEYMASHLAPVRVEAGTEIFRQGDPGDRFYVIAEGEVEVVVDGQVGAALGPGGYFGEMALLRKAPRMATVTARGDLELFALGPGVFLATVGGHAAAAEVADAVMTERLAELRAGGARV